MKMKTRSLKAKYLMNSQKGDTGICLIREIFEIVEELAGLAFTVTHFGKFGQKTRNALMMMCPVRRQRKALEFIESRCIHLLLLW